MAIQNNKVPDLWSKVSYPSLKPLSSWFDDMIMRVEFFRDWVESGKPMAFWVSAFFFPQGFLTAILQGFSRAKMIPVDVLQFENDVQDFDDPNEIEEHPEFGALLYGMFMDGVRWDYDNHCLDDQDEGVMFCSAPVIHFVPVENYYQDPKQYCIPLYKTSVRAGTLSTTGHSTNFVVPIMMDTQQNPQYWVLRGAALLCMLND